MLGRDGSDIDWLAAVVTDVGGPVLELACGTGRVTAPLAARTGVPVIGLDVDPAMLTAAGRRGVTHLVCADMRTFAFHCTFPVIALPYNSLQLLDDPGRDACVRAVATHLPPHGTFAVECTDFQVGATLSDVGLERLGEGRLPSGDSIALDGSLTHDLSSRTSIYRRRFTVARTRYDDAVRIRSLDRDELVHLLSRHGLAVRWEERIGARTRCLATVEAP